jgi:hypothetical protein
LTDRSQVVRERFRVVSQHGKAFEEVIQFFDSQHGPVPYRSDASDDLIASLHLDGDAFRTNTLYEPRKIAFRIR